MENQKYKFQLTCKSKIFGIKTCEMRLETGELLTYMPIPDGVRFCFGTIKRFYESEEGQKIIKQKRLYENMRFAIAPSGGKLSEKHWRS